jgi:hypothetical protein
LIVFLILYRLVSHVILDLVVRQSMALEEIRKTVLKQSSLCYTKCAVIFLSGFPDPFQDDGGGENCPTSQGPPPVLPPSLNLPVATSKPGAHKLESVSQCITTTVTPPSSPTLAPPRGHRRNMSDTSAFNK